METHGTHATFSTSSPRPWSPSKTKVVTHLSRKSLSTKLFLTHHPTPPTSPTQGRRATGTSAVPTLQRRTWGSNGKEYHCLRTVPETLRLRQGPCPGAWGPRPGSVGSTQAQRAEIVDIIWCPGGAQTRTDSDRPGLGPGPTAHLLFPSLSLFPQYITWEVPQMAPAPGLGRVLPRGERPFQSQRHTAVSHQSPLPQLWPEGQQAF